MHLFLDWLEVEQSLMDKRKHKVLNFVKQYKNSICLKEDLRLAKLIDFEETSGSCLLMEEDGNMVESSCLLIGLKDRIKDYNLIEAKFYKSVELKKVQAPVA